MSALLGMSKYREGPGSRSDGLEKKHLQSLTMVKRSPQDCINKLII